MEKKRIKNNGLLQAMFNMNKQLRDYGKYFTTSLTEATLFGGVYGIQYNVEITQYDRYSCGCIDHDNGTLIDYYDELSGKFLVQYLEDCNIDVINPPEAEITIFCYEDMNDKYITEEKYGRIKIIIYNDINSPCDYCKEKEEAKLFVEDMPPIDSLFNHEIVSHGLAAYRGSQNEDSIMAAYNGISDAMAAGTEIAICCSNKAQRIGPVGIYVRGHVYCASNIDLYSEREGDSRYVDTRSWRYQQGIISSKDQIDLTQWDHNEYIVNPREVIGFWMKDWAIKQWPGLFDKIRKLCEAHNMVLHVAKKRH